MFQYLNGEFHCEQVPLEQIARACGTPAYVYSSQMIRGQFLAYKNALAAAHAIEHMVCYAVKANSNLAILSMLASEGAGFDIVSGGELYRVLAAGGDPAKVVFSGVGKTVREIEFALAQGIHSFNVESAEELELLNRLAEQHGKTARMALRVNPDVDASTHPYISTGLKENKFGIDISEVEEVYARAEHLPFVVADIVSCHIGSQMLNPGPMIEALDKMLGLVERLRRKGHTIRALDFGGGIGVPYAPEDGARPDIGGILHAVCERMRGLNLALYVEPGRSIVAEAGVLLTQVLYTKKSPQKEFLVVDAAMNDLIRPALYKAHHPIVPLHESKAALPHRLVDVVGPVCESGDFLAKDRSLPAVESGDLLAIGVAGAYGFVQASNYNTRVRPPEIMVAGSAWRIVRERETYDELIRGERA